jgi:hypothetical protein
MSNRYAVVSPSGEIVNIIVAGENAEVPGFLLVLDTGQARIGGRWESGAFQDPPPTPPQVPAEVSRGQALIAMFQAAGITDAMIEAKIAAISDDAERYIARVRFQEPRWRRDSPFTAWGAEQFEMTPEQVDALFTLAATL